MMNYVMTAIGILVIEMCFVGAITGMFYVYDKVTSR